MKTDYRFLDPLPLPIPERWLGDFYPATHTIYEWENYWLQCAAADRLQVGENWIQPVADGLFPIRFENHLGLAALRFYKGPRRLGEPLRLEVISRKFGTLEMHRRFYTALLDEVFSSAACLPFAFAAPTARGVAAAASPPTPLFIYHFLRHYGPQLQMALSAIQARPHRELRDQNAFVPLSGAAEVDADVLLAILHTPEEWTPASGFPLADRLHGFAPTHVWQRLPEEKADTPENRFVLSFLQELRQAAQDLPTQAWWAKIGLEQQWRVRDIAGLLQEMILSPLFAGTGDMQYLPAQGLLRREGYRELLSLWNAFQGSRQPLFGRMQQAIEVRDIATLYEIWVFFRLVEEVGSLSLLPVEGRDLELRLSDETGLGWRAEARFGSTGTLIYNQPYGQPDKVYNSYSVPLRPDFTWLSEGHPEVILDAKFRLDMPPGEGDEDSSPQSTARQSDLYKMHAYRDSLGIRAAVALYPGDTALFYHRSGTQDTNVRLPQILLEEFSGVGAIPLRPFLERESSM